MRDEIVVGRLKQLIIEYRALRSEKRKQSIIDFFLLQPHEVQQMLFKHEVTRRDNIRHMLGDALRAIEAAKPKDITKVFWYEVPCSYCDDSNRHYLVLQSDGKVRIAYEGCGGYAGRRAEINGQFIENDKVEEILERIKKNSIDIIQSQKKRLTMADRFRWNHQKANEKQVSA